MKTLSAILFLVLFLTIVSSSTPIQPQEITSLEDDANIETMTTKSRFLIETQRTRKPSGKMTCDKYPRACRAKGSAGPDCCKKKCVDTWEDKLNCGLCGKRCKFSEICCKGKCVNPKSDERNCGGCYNRCKRGNSCEYGMCNYGD